MAQDDEHGKVSEATRRAEEQEAHSAHGADHPASAAEESLLNDEAVDEDVREHYQEMTKRGADEKGEGRIP